MSCAGADMASTLEGMSNLINEQPLTWGKDSEGIERETQIDELFSKAGKC